MADVEAALHSYMVELSISVYTKAGSAVIIYPERIGEETAKKKREKKIPFKKDMVRKPFARIAARCR